MKKIDNKLSVFVVTLFMVVLMPLGLQAAEISGVIEISDSIKSIINNRGILFVFARKAGDTGKAGLPPIAVLRITNPQFPQKFSITENNVMMPGTPFAGSMTVTARYSPSGDALDKSGPSGQDKKHKVVKIGFSKLKILLAI